METNQLIILIAVCSLFFIGFPLLFLLAHWKSKKFDEKLKQIASVLGFEYIGDDRDFHTRYPFRLFISGRPERQYAYNIIRGPIQGMTVVLATFKFTYSPSGIERTTICFIENTTPNFPEFSLVSLNLMTNKIFFGPALVKGTYQKDIPCIKFNQDTVFSDNFVLRSVDELQIKQVMTPERRNYFLKMKEKFDDFVIEGKGNLLLFFRRDSEIKPELENYQKLIDITLSIIEQFKN